MAGKAGDLELDAESMQDLSSTEVVRKSIPLKLKKPKLKLKGSKSSKSKKDKKSSSSSDHKETSSESKSHKSSKKQKSTTTIDGFPKSGRGELDWSQKIVAIGDKVQDPMIHMCEHCNHPILVYGRLTPCKHIFCLTCADKVNGQCPSGFAPSEFKSVYHLVPKENKTNRHGFHISSYVIKTFTRNLVKNVSSTEKSK